MEEKTKVPGQTQEEAAKIIARQQPAYAIGSTLAGGTIRGSKSKSSTKALEKIIKRQETRIEFLARENGNLACVLKSWEPLSERLFAATNSKGLSEAVAVAENVIAAYAKTRIVPVAKQE